MNVKTILHPATLIVFILASLLVLLNVLFMGIPGVLQFKVADFPWTFVLPEFHGDYWLEIGSYYGILWPVLIVVVFRLCVRKRIPEKWQKSPKMYRTLYFVILSTAMATMLALVFHGWASWGTQSYPKVQIFRQNE